MGVVKTLKDGTKMTTVVSWTRGDLVENTATVTVMYKHVELVGTLEWNVRDLAHGIFVVDVKGTKVPTLGDFMVNRNVKWEVKNAHEFELVWDDKQILVWCKLLPHQLLQMPRLCITTRIFKWKLKRRSMRRHSLSCSIQNHSSLPSFQSLNFECSRTTEMVF